MIFIVHKNLTQKYLYMVTHSKDISKMQKRKQSTAKTTLIC